MVSPSKEVIARPMVARACGCLQEFQQFAVDKYRAQRLAKFQKTRCSACVEKLNEEQKRAAAALPKKGELLQLLPAGTQITITRKADGNWSGSLVADGTEVKSDGEGTQGLVLALARLWVTTKGLVPAPAAAVPAPVAKPAAPAARPAAPAAKPASAAAKPASAPAKPASPLGRK